MKYTGERYIPGLSSQIELEHLNRYYFVINQIDLTDKVVLDLASGEGYGSDLLAKHSKEVIGIDISSEAIEYAKTKYKKNNLTFLIGDAAEIPLPEHSIDVFVSFETIEHHNKHIEMLKEIKRVLNPNGILVMSSPDKYYYSDLPGCKNDFHIKELYYEEYKNLINEYFKNTLFYSQKIFVGSIITLDEEKFEFKRPLVVEKDGKTTEFKPVYNIAVATDNLNFYPRYRQVLYKESDNLITNEHFDKTLETVKKSKAYRIGNFIITPFRVIRKIFNSFNKVD